jgi:hypothetical protein
MRVWAGLFGVVLTVGSAYIAQLAVTSAGVDRLARARNVGGDPAPGQLWYGGVLDPVTIEVSRAAPALALRSHSTSSVAARKQNVECAAPSRPKRVSISSENVRAPAGS